VPEKAALLPEPGPDDVYKAAGSPEINELSRLVLVTGGDNFRNGRTAYYFLQYVHLGVGEFGFDADGLQVRRFIYSDIQPKLVTMRGRNMLRICDQIALRRIPWIRQADRDFRKEDNVPDDEPILLKLEIVDWEPEESHALVELEAVA
jgi:hypothetical protein